MYFEYELQGAESMERIVDGLQEDWLAVCHLYQAVSDFAHVYKGGCVDLSSYHSSPYVLETMAPEQEWYLPNVWCLSEMLPHVHSPVIHAVRYTIGLLSAVAT